MIPLIIKSLAVISSAILYRLGGQSGYSKAFRRYGVPAVIGAVAIYNQNYLGLWSVPLLVVALSVGYGLNSFLMGVLNKEWLIRLVCGLLYSTAMLPLLWGNMPLFWTNTVGVAGFTMLAGTQAYEWRAAREEYIIGAAITFLPILGG